MQKPITQLDSRGFSLIEILIVVLIVGILLAASSFIFNRRGLELQQATRDLKNFTQTARFEAIRANQSAYVVISDQRVQVFVDLNQNATPDSGEPQHTLEASNYGLNMHFSANFSGESGFRWNSTGLPVQMSSEGFSAGVLNLNNGGQSACLVMSAGGRLRQGNAGECA